MPRVSAKRKAKSEIGRENIKKRWKKDDVSQHVVAELPASPDPPPPPSSTSFLQPPTQSAATFRHNLIPQQYREVQEKLMVCKMDPHNPEVKKENDIEDEASPSTILPNTSLYLQFGIKEESEGSENNQFMVEVKEESDIKIEEEDLPPQEDSLMFDGQEEPSLGESRSKKRTNSEIDTRIGITHKTDWKSHSAKRFKNSKEAREENINSSDLIHSSGNIEVPSAGSDVDTDASPEDNQQKNYADLKVQDSYMKCAPVNKISHKKDAVVVSKHSVQSKQKQKHHCNTRYSLDQYYTNILAIKKKNLEMKKKSLEQQLVIMEKEKEQYKIMEELTKKTTEFFSKIASTIELMK